MSTRPLVSETESAERRIATAPHENVWVSANAGAGKTSLLRDRVIRLLLDGVAPDRILCLTYTKAAAAEMQSRIFEALAGWVSLPEADLARAVEKLAGAATPVLIRRARQLFAEAVEAPGGLKIQTIHAFAERLLHLFPLEAGMPVDFTVMDEAEQKLLVEAATRATIIEANARPGSAIGRAFETILANTKITDFADTIGTALKTLRRAETRGGILAEEAIEVEIEKLLGVSPDADLSVVEDRMLAALPDRNMASDILDKLRATESNQNLPGCIRRFERYLGARSRDSRVQAAIGLSSADGKEAKEIQIPAEFFKQWPQYATLKKDMKEAVAWFLQARATVVSARASVAMHRFGSAVLARYRGEKRRRESYDFDDLINVLQRMLGGGQSAWVMMKLDAAIEHILVDEAQDTTPEMWEIVRALVDDFYSGQGQVRRARSLFVVGDEKQSIFSFQGAEPRVFEEKRQEFGRLIPDDNRIHRPVALRTSFRSSTEVLEFVDAVFAREEHRAGLTSDGGPTAHATAWPHLAGSIECWPLIAPPPGSGRTGSNSATVPKVNYARLAASRIARTIRDWLDRGERLYNLDRPVRPGDILILVRQRSVLFRHLLLELGEQGIPTTGADRLTVQDEPGVQDLLALASVALVPSDDLGLATALRTPIIGLDDATLERLCRGRTSSLRQAIGEAAPEGGALAAIHRWLQQLEQDAQRLSPHDVLARLLVQPCPLRPEWSGRHAMLVRLGADAADAIDALLTDALAFAETNPPSLALFIAEQARRRSEIKRDLEHSEGRVRIMTVHGAKGLEAPIVFLADAAGKPQTRSLPNCYLHSTGRGGLLLWAGSSAMEAASLRAAQQNLKALGFEEYRRLLYVGLTRARERLIVVGHQARAKADPDKKKTPEVSREPDWHTMVETTLRAHPVVQHKPGFEDEAPILLWPPAQEPRPQTAEVRQESEVRFPTLLLRPFTGEPLRVRPPERRRKVDAQGTLRGTAMHRLFEILPDERQQSRRARGEALLRAELPGLEPDEFAQLLDGVLRAIENPEHALFFGEGSRVEVPVTGLVRLQNGYSGIVSRRIDRLAVHAGGVEILDFKTSRGAPAPVRSLYLEQLALYRALVSDIFPSSVVRCHIFWTEGAMLETIEPGALDQAWGRITSV